MKAKPKLPRYGERLTPINKTAAIAVGLCRGEAYVVDGGMLPLAGELQRVAHLTGITFEVASKCLKRELDKYDLAMVTNAITAFWERQGISKADKKLMLRFCRNCGILVREMYCAVGDPSLSTTTRWKATKVCPSCGKKRLCRDFLFCPMCGNKLPQ